MTAVSDVPVFSDTDVPRDTLPDLPPPTAYEYACEVCGVELHYGGRGRKPTKCDEHKRGGKSTGVTRAKGLGQNAQLAAQATEALLQINGLVALILVWTDMPATSEAIDNAREAFREQTYAALLTDPGLCKSILKAGTTSGKMALVISYGMLAGAVAPVAMLEFKAKRAEKAERETSEDRSPE